MLDLNKVTLFAIYVPWDKSNISAEDFQDGEQEKSIDNGLEDTIKAIYTCMESAKFGAVRLITSKEVISEYAANSPQMESVLNYRIFPYVI